MTTLSVRVKHRIKGVLFRAMRRYDLGRRQLGVFSQDWDRRIAALEHEVSGRAGSAIDEKISDLQDQLDRLAAAAGNNARVIADLEERVAEQSAELARLDPGKPNVNERTPEGQS